MFSGFQNIVGIVFERRDANGNGRVVGSDAGSRTSNASEVFTDDAVINPRRLLAVQCGRVPREGASPMAPERCWFSPTLLYPLLSPPLVHPSLDSFFKTRRFITPPTANTSVSRNHSAVRAVPISVHDTRKFSLETTPQGGSCLSNNSTGHFTTRAPARLAGVHRRSKAFQSTNMSVEEKAEARADGDAVVGEKKKRGSDDEAGDLAGEDRPATVRAKVDTSESDAALARALGGVPDADVEPSVAPNLGLSEVRTLPPTSSRVPRPPLPPRSF